MNAQRIRRVKNRKQLEEMVDDFITQGYKVKSEGEGSVLLQESYWGTASMHIIILLLGGICLLGFANLAYALIAHSSSPTVLVKIDPA